MKLGCGKSWAAKVKYLEQWHPFFPFFPRRVGEYDCRSFEWIERKGELLRGYESGDYWRWQYRLPPQHDVQPPAADYTPRDVAQILCDNSPRCDDTCTHTSTEGQK